MKQPVVLSAAFLEQRNGEIRYNLKYTKVHHLIVKQRADAHFLDTIVKFAVSRGGMGLAAG